MFEVAADRNRSHIPWAVIANLLVPRPRTVRFDISYAKVLRTHVNQILNDARLTS